MPHNSNYEDPYANASAPPMDQLPRPVDNPAFPDSRPSYTTTPEEVFKIDKTAYRTFILEPAMRTHKGNGQALGGGSFHQDPEQDEQREGPTDAIRSHGPPPCQTRYSRT